MGFVSKLLNSTAPAPDSWYRRGKDLCMSGYYLDGLEALDRMIATDPLHADSWLLKGYAHYQMGQYEEALQFFDQSLAINPGLHEALTYKGLISSNFGKHLEALALYDRALAVNASYAKTWYIKGLTLAILEQYDDAIRSYEQALAIEPKHVDALAGISMAMKKRERAKGSPSISGPGTREKTPTRPVEAAARNVPAVPPALTSGEPQKIPVILSASYGKTAPVGQEKKPALTKKEAAATEGDDLPMIRRDLFETLSPIRENRTASIAADHERTGASPIREPHLNAYEEKICRYRESLDTNPEDPELWGSIGDLSMKTGKYKQAAEAYERALEPDEGNTRMWASLGDACKKMGAYDEAEAAYVRALELDPGQGHIWINKAKALTMLGRHEDAILACRQAILIDDTDIDAWLYKGFLLKKISRHSDALNAYDRVLAINPHHDQAIRQRRTLSDGV